MKKSMSALLILGLAAGLSWAMAQDKPEMPKPAKEHGFLKKFEGKWDSKMSMRHSADQPWMECAGTEHNRMVGDFWMVSEWKTDSTEMPMQGLASTGYDPIKKKYIVTWIGSTSPALSAGEGAVDGAGNILTTDVKSTDCQTGKPVSMTMVQEFKDKDTVAWSMRMKGKDGNDYECMKGESKRKK